MTSHLLRLLSQIVVILVAARLLGWVFRRFGQPQVVGEMVAGIALGPSLLGAIAPLTFARLFPPDSLDFLNALSQLGAILFMFVIGLELDLTLLRKRAGQAVAAALGSILVPLAAGYALGFALWPSYGEANVTRQQFAVFFACAISVTAFPVLARILTEQRLVSTRFGATALACAAVNDIAAWCLLAFVVLLVGGKSGAFSIGVTITLAVGLVAFVLIVVRNTLPKLTARFSAREANQDLLAVALMLMLASAWATERIGLHAIFGAFLMGVAFPKSDRAILELRHRLEDFTVVLLLPLFFAYTGLRTSIAFVREPGDLMVCALIIVIAIAGKIGGTAGAAHMAGMPGREALGLGVLMNTRGLMELVLLNIGLEIGVIGGSVYAMLVVMTIVTTGMTVPLLRRVAPITQPTAATR